ncbi:MULTISPECIES: lysophospholipid acyltransferase family protein [unclassified Paenibacillus]|uniref:lysophospholipid acyltransferase family protein n=1 Tax=unclassified Paenibacillus TaxID=185978 RepID=UPI001048D73B|nr:MULTISPECIES: lysophospholipid acyltransferase family protein [unclassified Paenibacillus]NIK67691.1 1-acyl-sn-glycerol-3-phosphate acyltransferase [Paenibacillus sp. BK720]TCN01732.1 1-acyl-sn-glycerol-3-phosphate acyltransferase [Paenibacillus sp. BK033]
MLYGIFRAVFNVLYGLLFRLEVRGLENIPKEGSVILCSNHISLLDPPAVGIRVPRKVHYMAKDELFKIPVFGSLIRAWGAFPVKRGVGKDAIRAALNLLGEGKVMGIFPEGTRNSDGAAAKKGAAMIAYRSGAAIIPVAVVGHYKLFRKMRVFYGKPVDISAIINESSPDKLDRITDAIMSRIYEMIEKNK